MKNQINHKHFFTKVDEILKDVNSDYKYRDVFMKAKNVYDNDEELNSTMPLSYLIGCINSDLGHIKRNIFNFTLENEIISNEQCVFICSDSKCWYEETINYQDELDGEKICPVCGKKLQFNWWGKE